MQLVREVRLARRPYLRARLTWLACITGVVTWIGVATLGFQVVSRAFSGACGRSKADIATLTVASFARDAFPQWANDHPHLQCPTSLDELTPYLNGTDTKDPWGAPYALTCTPASGPPIITSAGEDARFGTDDDVRSDEPPTYIGPQRPRAGAP